jgi:hypothetical protein
MANKRTYSISLVLSTLVLAGLACGIPGFNSPTPDPTPEPTPTDPNSFEGSEAVEITLELTNTDFRPGDEITVLFTAPSTFAEDAWVGIIPSDIPHGDEEENDLHDLEHQSMGGQVAGILEFTAPETPGSYDMRMFFNDSGGREVASVTFQVEGTQPAVEAPDVIYEGISFSYDDTIATNVITETIPENQGDEYSPYWDVYPEHYVFTFEGYILPDTFHSPKIFVYPIPAYEAMNDVVREEINDLRQLLVQRPTSPVYIPSLPIFNAAQMMRSNISYIDFGNGTGVRFLTQYGQSYYPINNQTMFYSFQGVSSDGKYYIAVTFPVSHPSLSPDGSEIPGGDFDAFANNFNNYISDMENQLGAEDPSTFNPNLDILDQFIMSLQTE